MLKKSYFKFIFLFFLILSFYFNACSNHEQIRKSAIYYFEEGNSALKQRDYQIAIWNFQKAINLDSESPSFHYNLGLVYFEIGNYNESIESFKRVKSLVPNQTDTYYNLALAHYKMSDSRMADIYYNRYQDMLSLRKAQERLKKVKKEQEKKARISDSEYKSKVLTESSSIPKKKSSLKNTSKKGTLKIPNWEN